VSTHIHRYEGYSGSLIISATFHSRHHRLYVPYAYGALYNHPLEGFVLDTVGTALAFKLAGMSTRQGLCLFTGATFKTVDDHCGYALPFDPLQLITSNNAGYHDVHHQSWGIKTNFSQPFFTFWDSLLGTKWVGGDVSVRYERARIAAQKKVDAESAQDMITKTVSSQSKTGNHRPYENETQEAEMLAKTSAGMQQPNAPVGRATKQAEGSREQVLEDERYGGPNVLAEEAQEEAEERRSLRRSTRQRATSSLQSEGLKGLRNKISSHGRVGAVLGMDHGS